VTGRTAVRVSDLHKRYDKLEAVDGLSFEIPTGQCFGLLGPNGAGKTTTVEILEGLLPPTSGEVVVLGRRWAAEESEIRERIGVCLQQTALSEKLEVHETLSLFRSLYRQGRDPQEVMEAVGLTEKATSRVGRLSGGQKQRLAVGLGLVGDPELLFLDEPTTGLDPQSRRQIWEIVHAFKGRGRSVLLTTHYMDEAERLSDQIAVIDHGRVIAEGSPRELIRRLGGDHVVEIQVPPRDGRHLEARELEDTRSVRSVLGQADHLMLTVAEPHLAIPALLDKLQAGGWELANLTTRHASLEDVFVSLTGRHLRDDGE